MIDYAAVVEKYQAAKKVYEDALAEAGKLGAKVVVALLQPIFDANPTLDAVRWSQYTPYFNDGEPCTFRVNEPYIRGQFTGRYEEEDGYFDSYSFDEGTAEQKMCENAAAAIYDLGSDFLLATFDDHVQVEITRDGAVEVEEYSHD